MTSVQFGTAPRGAATKDRVANLTAGTDATEVKATIPAHHIASYRLQDGPLDGPVLREPRRQLPGGGACGGAAGARDIRAGGGRQGGLGHG